MREYVRVGLALVSALLSCTIDPGEATGARCSDARPCPDDHSCMETVDGGVCVKIVCNQTSDCAAGMVCEGNICQLVCIEDDSCLEDFLCEEGKCQPDASPRLGAVWGNGSDSCPGAAGARCFADGLVVDGHNLADAQLELQGARTWMLARTPGVHTHQRVTVMLPTDLVEGSYTLTALNQAGSDQQTLTILKGEPGDPGSYVAGVGVTIVDDTISADIGTSAGQVAGGDVVAALEARIAALENLQLGDTTLQVGPTATYPNVAAALAFLADKRVAPDAKVTIQIADGAYTSSTEIELTHPDGDRLEIVGNVGSPGNVTLTFNGSNGFAIWGYDLGLLDGVTILGNDTSGTNGIAAAYGELRCGSSVIVDGFGVGFYAHAGGHIEASDTASHNNEFYGYLAEFGGYVRANNGTATGNGIGGGFSALNNGMIVANQATADSNTGTGFSAGFGGTVLAFQATSSNNLDSGFSASVNGTMHVPGADAISNTGYGFAAHDSGMVSAGNSTADSNGDDGFWAHRGGVLSAAGSTSLDNGDHGFSATIGAVIDAHNATVSGNTSGGYSHTVGTLSSDGSFIEP